MLNENLQTSFSAICSESCYVCHENSPMMENPRLSVPIHDIFEGFFIGFHDAY